MGDATYRLLYDLDRREVTMEKSQGQSTASPLLSLLPRFRGFTILLKDRQTVRTLRG